MHEIQQLTRAILISINDDNIAQRLTELESILVDAYFNQSRLRFNWRLPMVRVAVQSLLQFLLLTPEELDEEI